MLIIGAAGGVGTFAVQLAKAFGARGHRRLRHRQGDLVRSIGADHVIDYTATTSTRGPAYDLILDTAGNRPLSRCGGPSPRAGRGAIVGGESGKGSVLGGFERQLGASVRSIRGGQKLRAVTAKENAADLEVLTALIEAGTVVPAVGRVYQLADAPQAIRDLHDGHARGKAVVQVLSP